VLLAFLVIGLVGFPPILVIIDHRAVLFPVLPGDLPFLAPVGVELLVLAVPHLAVLRIDEVGETFFQLSVGILDFPGLLHHGRAGCRPYPQGQGQDRDGGRPREPEGSAR
jgi:hypothetical protein